MRPTLTELAREFRQGVAGNKALSVFNHAIVASPKVLNSQRLFAPARRKSLEWHVLATKDKAWHLPASGLL